MKAIYAVANHNPNQVLEALLATKAVKESDILFSRFKQELTAKQLKDHKIVFLGGIATCDENIEVMDANTNCIAIILDDAIKCDHYTKVWTDILDVNNKPQSHTYRFGNMRLDNVIYMLKAKKPKKPAIFVQDKLDILPRMLSEVKGSVTQHVVTLTNYLTTPEVKSKVLMFLANWLAQNNKPVTLAKDLDTFITEHSNKGGKNLSAINKGVESLVVFLRTEGGKKFHQAYVIAAGDKATGKSPNYKKLGDEFGVDLFDLKYLFNHFSINNYVKHDINKTLREIHKEAGAE